MTAQIPDQFRYEGEAYDLVGLDGGTLYEPLDFGITTKMASTACWRGYQMFYDCKNGVLILDAMHTRSDDKIPVNGVTPKESMEGDPIGFFNTFYENLGLKTKFTGSLLLARDLSNHPKDHKLRALVRFYIRSHMPAMPNMATNIDNYVDAFGVSWNADNWNERVPGTRSPLNSIILNTILSYRPIVEHEVPDPELVSQALISA